VVVSPQLPDISLEMRKQMKLEFDLLFDAANNVADAYGIAMRLPDDLIKIYASFGIDLPRFDGDNSWRLPGQPPTFVGGDILLRLVHTSRLRMSGRTRLRGTRLKASEASIATAKAGRCPGRGANGSAVSGLQG
jgi:hypothetical protein